MVAFVTLLLHFGLAAAQITAGITAGVNIGGTLPSGCPSVLTLTVLPPDYTGSLLSIPVSAWPSLSTLGLPSISIPGASLTLPPVTGLPSLLPSATLDVPTIPLPVSAILPTIPVPSPTAVSFTCQQADGQVIIQNGLPYAVDCGATATGSVYLTVPAVSSFNDCFHACDTSSTDQGAKFCTGFSYEGAIDGQGSGTCYLQNSVAQGFTSEGISGSSNLVAGVRLLNYLAGGNAPLPTLLPTNPAITSQSPGGVGSLLPTDLPLTQVPDAVSSILAGLTSGLTTSTNIPLTTELPNAVSSILSEVSNLATTVPTPSLIGQLSSILPQQPTGISLPISSLVNGATTNIPSPTLHISSLGDLTSLPIITPSISVPSLTLPSVSTPSLGTNLLSTIGTDGLPTLLSITPTVILPSVTVSLPTDVSLPGVSTNLITIGLGGGATVISAPTLSSFSSSVLLPSVSISVSSLSPSIPAGSSLSVPSSRLSATNLLTSLSLPGGGSPSTRTDVSSASNPLVAPTATALPLFGCPADSGLAYVSPSGQAFRINCGVQVIGYDISTALQPNLQSCVNSCGSVQGCTNVIFQASTNLCSYKSQNGQRIGATTHFSAAIAIDLSCSSGNGIVYMDPFGAFYQILCDTTFPSRTEIEQTAAPSGRLADARSLALERRASNTNFLPCCIRCSALTACIAVTATDGFCIFISNLGPVATGSTTADTAILVAKRIVSLDAYGDLVTSTSTAAPAPTITTSRSSSVYYPPTTTAILPSAAVSASVRVSAAVGADVTVSASAPLLSLSASNLLGGGADPPVSTSDSITRTQITLTVPVTTLLTTSTVTSCSTNLLNQVQCPIIAVVETLVGTRTTVTQSYITTTPSTLSTATRSSSSSSSSRTSTSACVGIAGLGC